MLEDGTELDILLGNLYGYKGAIFENLVADFFVKMKRPLFYFQKESGLEADWKWILSCATKAALSYWKLKQPRAT